MFIYVHEWSIIIIYREHSMYLISPVYTYVHKITYVRNWYTIMFIAKTLIVKHNIIHCAHSNTKICFIYKSNIKYGVDLTSSKCNYTIITINHKSPLERIFSDMLHHALEIKWNYSISCKIGGIVCLYILCFGLLVLLTTITDGL